MGGTLTESLEPGHLHPGSFRGDTPHPGGFRGDTPHPEYDAAV